MITSAVGHLVEIAAPEAYDVKRGKWSFANLPVLPPHFDLRPIEKTKSRLNAVVRLAKRKDVDRLINACDAGREGELIFRLSRAIRQRQEAIGQTLAATVVAIHDAASHPRWLCQLALRCANVAAG